VHQRDGNLIHAWRDKWLGSNIVLAQNMEHIPPDVSQWTVAEMVNDSGNWKMEILSSLLPMDLVNKIKALPPPRDADGSDERVWPGDRLRQFTVSSAYKMLAGYRELEIDDMWRCIWKLNVPERIRHFIWRLRYGRLPTNKACHRWGFGAPYCVHCVSAEESIIHVLRDCPLAHHTWNHLLPMQGRLAFFTCHFNDWFQQNMTMNDKLEGGVEWRVVWAVSCYHLWLWRNKENFDGEFVRPRHTARYILQYIEMGSSTNGLD
jgi:hypothetical protein